MSELTIYDKSEKYGDLQQGFAACLALSTFIDTIDLRNPATVKYARLLLGNSEAVRDSIDDIASYAKKTGGELSFKPDTKLPTDILLVVNYVADYKTITSHTDPVEIAYVVAFLSALRRGDYSLAMSLLLEFSESMNVDGVKTLLILANKLIDALEGKHENDK